MKKIIAIFIAILTVFALGVCASAEDGEPTEEICTAASQDAESFPKEDDAAGEIFDAILENVSGIVSILTFAISVILTLLYKKGLMPTLGGALGSIDSTVKSFGERAESGIASAEEAVRRIDVRIEDMGGVIDAVSKALAEIDRRMLELEENRSDKDSIKVMMRTQVEELWEMFSSSELSEISKKTFEEKLTVIKAHLDSNE